MESEGRWRERSRERARLVTWREAEKERGREEGVGERVCGSGGICVKGWGMKFVFLLPTECWKDHERIV